MAFTPEYPQYPHLAFAIRRLCVVVSAAVIAPRLAILERMTPVDHAITGMILLGLAIIHLLCEPNQYNQYRQYRQT